MTTKRVIYTYTPSDTDAVIVIKRNSDGYTLDAVDEAFKASPGTGYVQATESPSTPGVFIWDSDGSAWQDDTYRFFWYPDNTLADAPTVWTLTLESDAEPTAGSSIRAELGMAAADLDTQLDAINTLATAASIRSALGMAAADLDTQLDAILTTGGGDATEATLQQIKAQTDLIVGPGSADGWANYNTALPSKSLTVVSDLFDDVREVLHDPEANLYPNRLMVPLYNRAISEINNMLVHLGADVAISNSTITGDGTNYQFLIDDETFLAPVPQQFKPRSPATATTAYSWGRALYHSDPRDVAFTTAPTTVASPDRFYISTSANNQYIVFNAIPPSGYLYDMRYFTVQTPVVMNTSSDYDIGTATIPWLGFLDQLVARSLEEFAREGKEFTSEKRALWRARAEEDIAGILGLRHLQSQERTPSLYRNMPTTNEVF